MESIYTVLFGALILTGLFMVIRNMRGDHMDGFEAQLSRAVDAFRLGEGEEGDRLLAEMEEHLRNPHQRRHAAHALMSARAWEQSLQLAEEGLREEPTDPELVRMRAILHAYLQDPDAYQLLHTWLQTHPKDETALFALVEYLLALRKIDLLETWLLPYIEKHPKNHRAHSLLGQAYFHDYRLADAKKHLHTSCLLRERDRQVSVSPVNLNGAFGAYLGSASEALWQERHDNELLAQIDQEQHEARTAAQEREEYEASCVSEHIV